MKKLLAVALVLIVLSPAVAFAGSSTDAALALGAFAVFNQILSGTGIFGGLLGHQAVVVAPPRSRHLSAGTRCLSARTRCHTAGSRCLRSATPVVVVRPAPVFAPRGGYYAPAPVYRHAPRPVPVARGWCPPGHMRHGRCY